MIDPTIQYDVVELPSRGILYPNKTKAVLNKGDCCRGPYIGG
jgi:hypothetical protein